MSPVVTRSRALSSPAPSDTLPDLIALEATNSLLLELATWPKPGLVSFVDNGSHLDMSAKTLQSSAAVLRPYFAELTSAGMRGDGMAVMREIGLRAESAMLTATDGINTHRGAIFGLGLLCAAAGQALSMRSAGSPPPGLCLGAIVARRWGQEIMRGPIPLFSHGSAALRKHGARGAHGEAAKGFRSIYEVGLPAFRLGRVLARGYRGAAAVQSCFALIASVRDTNLLHRGGEGGARYAADAAAGFLASGGVGAPAWRERAVDIHLEFVRRKLSPGGCADLLAMTLFVEHMEVYLPQYVAC